MAKHRTKLRIALEYAAVRAVLAVFRRVPTRWTFALTDRLAGLAYRLDRSHREVAQANMAAVFGGAPSDPRHQEMTRAVFRSFLRVAAETALLPDLLRDRGVDDLVDLHGGDELARVIEAGRGGIIFSAHVGNWESVGAGAAAAGLRYHAVGREMDNPWLDRYLTEQRLGHAVSVIKKDNALPRVARLLRDRQFVVMLIDQHAGRNGLVVDFLGRPASTFRAPAELAVRFGVPLIGAYGVRISDRPRFRLQFLPPIFADPSQDRQAEVLRLTQRMSDMVGEWVMAYPEQWNWLHRRWRVDPERWARSRRGASTGESASQDPPAGGVADKPETLAGEEANR